MSDVGPLVCIVGPTASGKSAVADRIAQRVSGEVVSVDAMQVYKGMDIGTAKTPPEERLCTLHMVDICPINANYSVERFQTDARSCIDGLLAGGIRPILCGGTGLYLNAVIDEMDFPSGFRGDSRREAYEELARSEGPQRLHEMLRERDPESADEIHPNNTRRVIRALEMCDEGKSYAASLRTLHARAQHYRASIYGLELPREELYRRIDRRVDDMFDKGLVEEVQKLVSAGLSSDTTAGQAIGYKEILEALSGTCSMDDAREAIKTNTRRYAKRQISWFRHDARVKWIDMQGETADSAAEHVISEVFDAAF